MAKNYCFTVNNPTAPIDTTHPQIGYIIYQQEIGENGTVHFQGYVEWKSKQRITAIKKFGYPWSTCHLEIRRGTQAEAIAYCSKEDTRDPSCMRVEVGTKSENGKARSYSAMISAIAAGVVVDANNDEHLEEYAKHKRNVDAIQQERKKMKKSDIEVDISSLLGKRTSSL